jgi:hypothetical protein
MGVQRLGVSTPSINTDTLIYTADYPFLASVIGTNLTTSTSLIDVWVVPTGVTQTSGYVYYAYQTDIPPSNTLETHKFALNIGDRVYVRSTQSTSFNLAGLRQVDIQLATGVTSFQNIAPTNPINGQVWVDGDGVAGTNISSLAGYNVQASSATQVPFTVQGASGQTADLQQWDHSSGAALAKVDSTGLVYSQQSPVINRDGFNAGGKNYIINGGFDIWQRGTSFTGQNEYTADRFKISWNGANGTTTRQLSGIPGIQYCQRIQRNAGNANVSGVFGGYALGPEDVIPLQSKVVTLSAYVRAGANYSSASSLLFFGVNWGTGTGGQVFAQLTNDAVLASPSFTLTTAWQRVSFTMTIPSTATELRFYPYYYEVGTAGANDYFEWTGVQLELGPTPTAFSRYGGGYAGELAACLRYYWQTTSSPNGAVTIMTGGLASGTSNVAQLYCALPSPMRSIPTASIASTNLQFWDATGGGSGYSVGAITAQNSSAYQGTLNIASSGLTNNNRYNLLALTGSTGYLAFSAEF